MKKENKLRLWLKSLWKDRTLILMALPAVIVLILFAYVPMSGLVLAFKNFNFSDGIFGSPWNGFDNFRYLFLSGKTVWRITRNTVGYYFLFTAAETTLAVALALAINEMVFKRFAKLAHSALIMPYFISAVAIMYVVSALLNYDTGMINQLLESLGLERINFYMQGKYWPFILLLCSVWQGVGYSSVLYLATLTGIDQELYEAADIDGVNKLQRIRYISLPMLKSIVIIRLLLSLGQIMKSNTGLFYRVTRNVGALYEYTQTIDAYVLDAIQKSSNFGATAAVTLFQSVVGCVALVVVNMIVRKVSPEDALF